MIITFNYSAMNLVSGWSGSYLFLICIAIIATGCKKSEENKTSKNDNQAKVSSAKQFDTEASDGRAIAIADSVMKAMGGKEQWESTRVISWSFFGQRTHTWDKKNNRDRIEIPSKNLMMQFNIDTKEGIVEKNGQEITQPDSVQKYLQKGYEMWVNDSYWLVMPYKLKDPGVTLEYMGIDKTKNGTPAYKLKLTYDDVGVTPKNKFHVFVDTTDYLVRQWAYFPEASMDKPQFVMPWKDYKQYGSILLSGNRGEQKLTDIKVMERWPKAE